MSRQPLILSCNGVPASLPTGGFTEQSPPSPSPGGFRRQTSENQTDNFYRGVMKKKIFEKEYIIIVYQHIFIIFAS
jgi:hypothetical protein